MVTVKCKRTNTVAFDDHVFSYEVKLDDECILLNKTIYFKKYPKRLVQSTNYLTILILNMYNIGNLNKIIIR